MFSTFALMLALAAEPLPAGDSNHTLTIGELERGYLLHVPPQYDPQTPTPVVVCVHGAASSAERIVTFTGMSEKADQAGFIVAYPRGSGPANMLTFNGGNCCADSMKNDVDDVAFVRAMLDDVAKIANVDVKRVYATGMSNGAMLTFRLGSELSDRIAAIAPVGGPMGTESCRPTRPVSVIYFHGTEDKYVPFAGGHGERGLVEVDFYSVSHSIDAWVKADGCPNQPLVERLADKADDGMTVTRKTYGPGTDGAEVVLVEIVGGGHTWPGRETKATLLGPSTKDISATDLIWEFFERHPRK